MKGPRSDGSVGNGEGDQLLVGWLFEEARREAVDTDSTSADQW